MHALRGGDNSDASSSSQSAAASSAASPFIDISSATSSNRHLSSYEAGTSLAGTNPHVFSTKLSSSSVLLLLPSPARPQQPRTIPSNVSQSSNFFPPLPPGSRFATIDVKELYKQARSLYDKVYYGDVLPPVGSAKISYAKLLQLLAERKVKRLYLMADGRYALVEVPVPGTASIYDGALYDKRDPSAPPFAEQRPEWMIEKWR